MVNTKRKDVEHTGNLGEALMEELQVETTLTIAGIPIYESVVVTWIIMAVIVIACILLTRNLKVENPGKVQLFLESVFSMGYKFFYDILGENGKQYIGYLMTVILYIGNKPVFLVNSCLGLFSAAHFHEHPLFRSYGVNLPSSLTTLLPLALESSSYLPVSVCGTGTLDIHAAFLASYPAGLRY